MDSKDNLETISEEQSKRYHSRKKIGLVSSLVGISLYVASLGLLGSCTNTGNGGGDEDGDNPQQAGTITELVASPSSVEPGQDVTFTATIDYNQGGTDTLEVDPDGPGPMDPLTKTFDVPYGGASGLEKTVTGSYPDEGTYTPEAIVHSNPGLPEYGNDVDVSNPPLNYESVESIVLENDSGSGELSGNFYNPAGSEATKVKIYASFFDHDIETLLANGDAQEVVELPVSEGQDYDFNVTGLDPNATTTLYFVPGTDTEESYADSAKDTEISSGMPEVGNTYNLQFTGTSLPDGTTVSFLDKYGAVRETVDTIDNMVAGLINEVAEDQVLDIAVDGYGVVDDMTYNNMSSYNNSINL